MSQKFDEEEKLGKAYDGKLMKRLLGYAKPYWMIFLTALVLLFAVAGADLLRPYLIKVAIDSYMNSSQMSNPERIHGVMKIGWILLAAVTIGFVFNYIHIYMLTSTGQKIVFNIRQEIFKHMEKLPVSFFDKNPVGRLVTRVTNDTEALNEMYTSVLVNLLKDIILIIGSAAGMFLMDVRLTLITIGLFPIILGLTMIFRVRAREAYRQVRVKLAKFNSILSENLTGMQIVHIFNRQKQKNDEFKGVNYEYYMAGKKEVIVYGIFAPAIEFVAILGVAAIVWYGGDGVIKGTIAFGTLYAFVTYLFQLFQPINDLAEKYNILQSAMASSERIFHILDQQPELKPSSDRIPCTVLKGTIEFKNVWFAYHDEDWVLRDISFKIEPGQTVAFVGATGAGKTSVINLINRFYEIQQGEILIDEVNIQKIGKEDLRKNIAVVLQDVFLFSGDIASNIRLNSTDISAEKVREVAEYVNASHFIEKFPGSYSHEVKERGATLSAGQRQLLAFARALAFDPPILVLDEATAHIDTETELLIQDALEKITENRTTIVIAHRLSTIQHADNIIVLHHGKIKELGNHQELLQKKGMYYDLYRLQIGAGVPAKVDKVPVEQ